MSDTKHSDPHPTKAEALAQLENEPLSCVTWMENGKLMSAIYWNGRRHIQPADAKFNWSKKQ
jgi:hypothetical protein